MAGVEQNQIGIIGAVSRDIAFLRKAVRHALAVIDVHLAAIGLHKDLTCIAANRVCLDIGHIFAHARLSTVFIATLEGDKLTLSVFQDFASKKRALQQCPHPVFHRAGKCLAIRFSRHDNRLAKAHFDVDSPLA